MKLASRQEAVFIGNQLLSKGIFAHVTHDHTFEDKHLFYAFSDYWVAFFFSRSVFSLSWRNTRRRII